jgi:hypothetical protein
MSSEKCCGKTESKFYFLSFFYFMTTFFTENTENIFTKSFQGLWKRCMGNKIFLVQNKDQIYILNLNLILRVWLPRSGTSWDIIGLNIQYIQFQRVLFEVLVQLHQNYLIFPCRIDFDAEVFIYQIYEPFEKIKFVGFSKDFSILNQTVAYFCLDEWNFEIAYKWNKLFREAFFELPCQIIRVSKWIYMLLLKLQRICAPSIT